jgi:hypothetical protein
METIKHGTSKQIPVEIMALNMAEGLMDELEKAGKTKKKEKEMTQDRLLSAGLQFYAGIILSLAGSVMASGRGTWFVIVLTVLLFLMDSLELSFMPEKKRFPAQIILGGTILLIAILQVSETIGKNFSLNVFYLLLTLLGGLFILIDVIKTGNAKQVKS